MGDIQEFPGLRTGNVPVVKVAVEDRIYYSYISRRVSRSSSVTGQNTTIYAGWLCHRIKQLWRGGQPCVPGTGFLTNPPGIFSHEGAGGRRGEGRG
jgi:hypothetical protein